MKSKWWSKIVLGSWFLVLGLVACSSNKTAWEYMPDMADQPALKAQEFDKNLKNHRSLGLPVPGTIPTDFFPYPYKGQPEAAGVHLKNPLPVAEKTMQLGEKTFKIYCQVCHGERGLGDGTVIPKFPKPPSLQSEKVREWPDGRIYHVITEGQNLMPSYASQIPSERRWAAILYLRALQRAEHPTPADLEAYKNARK